MSKKLQNLGVVFCVVGFIRTILLPRVPKYCVVLLSFVVLIFLAAFGCGWQPASKSAEQLCLVYAFFVDFVFCCCYSLRSPDISHWFDYASKRFRFSETFGFVCFC